MDPKAAARLSILSMHISPSLTNVNSVGGVEILESSAGKSVSRYEKVHGKVSLEPPSWQLCSCPGDGSPFIDIIYEKAIGEGIAKVIVYSSHILLMKLRSRLASSECLITINRPERRNAFRPQTLKEMTRALNDARDDIKIGVIILTGKGNKAFCSGGDQAVRGPQGYVDTDSFGRLNVLDVQVQIRRLPKPVIAMVAGYAVGGGNVLHMVCDLTIAADNAVFGQTGPKVGSFDAGYGCSVMSRLVGTKRAREMWFLSRFYSANEAMEMGLINTVVPLENLEQETLKWSREMLRNSPTAIRVCKAALNAVDDGHAGLNELAGTATLLYYGSEEANEGKSAYLERRRPDFSRFPRLP